MKAIAKLFETMLTKDATPTWGRQSVPAGPMTGFGLEQMWGWGN